MRIRLYDEDVDEIEGYLSTEKDYSDEEAMRKAHQFDSYIRGEDFRVEEFEGTIYNKLEEFLNKQD